MYNKFVRAPFLLLSVILLCAIIPHTTHAADTASLSPSTVVDDTSVGTQAWSNVDNVKVSDDTYATAQSFCFVAGTKIKTATGEVNIESLQNGQYVLGFDAKQHIENSKVIAIGSKEVNEVVVVVTNAGSVTTTPEHPFYVGNGQFKEIKDIKVGEYLYDSGFLPHRLLSKTSVYGKTTVYNLAVENTHTYFANNYAVHNKSTWHYLKATGFGFAIPAGATINGIQAEVEFKSNANNGTGTDGVFLVKNGTVGSTNRGLFNNNFPLTDTSTFYGSSSDLWGDTWTADDINNANFGFVFNVSIFAEIVSVDHMALVVSYTPDTTAPSVSLTAPTDGSLISGSSVPLTATASDDISVAGVTFYVDGNRIGSEDTGTPFTGTLDSTSLTNGSHSIVAVARDTANNYATSTAAVVTVDNIAPVISNIIGRPSTAGATITWTTDKSATSKVSFGTNASSYGTEISSASSVTSHTINLSDLSAATKYYYVVVSTDVAGNISTSSEQTLTTAPLQTQYGGSHGSSSSSMRPTTITIVPNTITPNPLAFIFTKDLKFGMTDADVALLQTYLNAHGFLVSSIGSGSPSNETSVFGTRTRNALIGFQKSKGIIPAFGYFGPLTRTYVNSH